MRAGPAKGIDHTRVRGGFQVMATVIKILGLLGDRLQSGASVRAVFGDPVEAHGRTVIPVARIGYGFGAGGRAAGNEAASPEDGYGSGGGAGLRARPVGALEITAGGTRFIPFIAPARLGILLLAGFLIGLRIGRRSRTDAAKPSR